MCISIGSIELKNQVSLAPMSGITDEPFRKIAHRFGAGLVISEMIASEALVDQNPEMILKATGRGNFYPFAMQLAGREAKWMALGAKMAEDLGADLIDINMGCPARKVTRGLSGSALMQDLDHALKLIEATVTAVNVPVTLKMRLGWDHDTLNAAELSQRAESAGIQLITVHGRTRCQFYTGKADWKAIAPVKKSVSLPVIANGDIENLDDARRALSRSGADGVMVGRGAQGQPWILGQIADGLSTDSADLTSCRAPDLETQFQVINEHFEDVLVHYGQHVGVLSFRKHLSAYISVLSKKLPLDQIDQINATRQQLVTARNPAIIKEGITALFDQIGERIAA